MYFYILLKRGKVNLTDVYNASVNYDHPTLFSIPMNDLVSMLDKAGVGVQVSNQLINSLLFADDITLIVNSEQELNTLLNITSL
jgi:hypothetical protein